ncbi:MAG: hypothetical protein KC583_22590 [Myxococcales bacterium]|nr:hypothetical protein [Myxococcales bacterium]
MRRTSLIAGLLLVACGSQRVVSGQGELPPPPPGVGFVRVQVDPPDADLVVDGRYLGRVDGYARGVVRLPEGARRLELRKKGFEPWYGLVVVGPEAATIDTRLVPEVPRTAGDRGSGR